MKWFEDSFVIREVGGEHLLIPIGRCGGRNNMSAIMNEYASFVLSLMKQELDEEEILDQVTEEYDVDRDTAGKDLREFFEVLRTNGLIR